MRQVLFHIPLPQFAGQPSWWPEGVPLFGYGTMLCITLLVTIWLGSRRARREGINPQILQDMAFFIFIPGILGARITYMIQYHVPIRYFFNLWDGGIVFYGSALGGVVGYVAAYFLIIRKHGLSSWKIADIVAPCVAIGLCLGRVGCLLNGCCFGNVACDHCPGIRFPLSSPARFSLTEKGLQTAAGFVLEPNSTRVAAVEPNSDAATKGLRPGDVIVAADGQPIHSAIDLSRYLLGDWPRGKIDLSLEVVRRLAGAPTEEKVTVADLEPRTLPLHPTQIYESISMILLLLVLFAYEPFRRRDGMVMAVFMIGYPVHRFLNEMLRNDTDPVAFGMTLSQNGSLLLFLAGLSLFIWLWRQPVQYRAEAGI